ncbi:MAG: PadR family transcriptional regulator, partial [Acidimicrobiales bacterium]
MAILGLLKERPMHGYDLRKRLRGDTGLLASLSFGSLYPALARLQASGAVRELPAGPGDPAGPRAALVPLSGSLTGERAAFRARLASRASAAAREARTGGRARKVYELTAAGSELFERLLTELAPAHEDERAFPLRWAFAR